MVRGRSTVVKREKALGGGVQRVLHPGHEVAQLRAGLLDLVAGVLGAQALQLLVAVLDVGDEALGEGAVLDVGQDVLHALLGVGVDDARAGEVAAELRGVGHRVVHVGDAALEHQVNDELQLVQALEVRHLRLVTGLDQHLETNLDQLLGAAAQHGLLAEQVGLGFFTEVGLDDAGLAAAVGHRVRQGNVARRAGLVLVDGDQVRHCLLYTSDAADDIALV